MRKFIYCALIVLSIALTVISVAYAYDYRGYFAIGGEYGFLLLPLFGAAVDGMLQDQEAA